MQEPLGVDGYSRVVVLTGAGVSVASGLRPYRGPGGLWTDSNVPKGLTGADFARDPWSVWSLLGPVRRAVLEAEPNAAHVALAEAEKRRRPGTSFTVLTQNIDRLHQRAGSADVVEIHGALLRTRCGACDREPREDHETHASGVPTCAACGAPERPDVVLFDEMLPVDAERRCKQALRECDLFVAIGTSGTVSPASNFVRAAEYAGARTVLVNLEPMSPHNPAYDREILGRAEELVPVLFAPG